MNRRGDKKLFIIVGILFVLVGLAFLGKDIYTNTNYDKTESIISIYTLRKNNRKAKVTYTYDGKKYEDIALSSFNGFTMKDGKEYMIYINPDNPEHPITTSYALDIIFAGMGVLSIYAGINGKPKGKRLSSEEVEDIFNSMRNGM